MKTGYDQFFRASKKQALEAESPNKKIKLSRGGRGQGTVLARAHSARPANRFPWLAILVIGSISGLLGWYHESPETFTALIGKLKTPSVSIFGQAIAKDSDGKIIPPASVATEKTSATEVAGAQQDAEKKKSWTDEEVALFRHLETRKKELDQKEEALKKLEEELQKQKDEVAMRLQQLEETRKKISGQLEGKVQADLERVEKLVAFYSNMKPQSAAKVFQDLDEDLVVELLQKMKQKNAADIMNLLPAEKAQKLTERFAGYRRN